MDNWVRCEMTEQVYLMIPAHIREGVDILNVEPKEFDYSKVEKWKLAKIESDKAYKKLKKIEFEIRNNDL